MADPGTVLNRLIRLALSALAGLLLCVSFPPVGWWWAAVPALALLTWLLVAPQTTMAGGFGYGLVFDASIGMLIAGLVILIALVKEPRTARLAAL